MSVSDNRGLLLHMVNHTRIDLTPGQVESGTPGVPEVVSSISLHHDRCDKHQLWGAQPRERVSVSLSS